MPSFDSLESRQLLSATQVWYDANGNAYSTSQTQDDPSLGATPIVQLPAPTIVYPAPGPASYDVGAGGHAPY